MNQTRLYHSIRLFFRRNSTRQFTLLIILGAFVSTSYWSRLNAVNSPDLGNSNDHSSNNEKGRITLTSNILDKGIKIPPSVPRPSQELSNSPIENSLSTNQMSVLPSQSVYSHLPLDSPPGHWQLPQLPQQPPQSTLLRIEPKQHQDWKRGATYLISEGMPVLSDVRGNLGPASMITSEVVNDWLKDRWQAAKNMRGEPIPGQHWLQIDLQQRTCIVKKFLIDWETAFGKEYDILGKKKKTDLSNSNNNNDWVLLYSTKLNKQINVNVSKRKQHIIHEFSIADDDAQEIEAIKLNILKGGTQWGVSVWRFQVWGMCKGE